MHKVIFKKPNEKPVIKEIDLGELSDLNDLIGGYITVVGLPTADQMYLIVLDEEGYHKNLQPNIRMFGDTIVGNVVVLKQAGVEFEGLTEEDILIIEKVHPIFSTLRN